MDAQAIAAATGGAGSTGFVSKLLKLAFGLFVTSAELPHLTPEAARDISLGYNCSFDTPCRWTSTGPVDSVNHWLQGKGEPESIVWLASTGTMERPKQPFAFIELSGKSADSLTSDIIRCQHDTAQLSFTYWTIGNGNLEICLLDEQLRRFNCTGMLPTQVKPGKVALQIPPVNQPFYISLIPNTETGILIMDDIKYTADYCLETSQGSRPDLVLPWTPAPLFPTFATMAPLVFETTTIPTTTTTQTTTPQPTTVMPTVVSQGPTIGTTEPPFELMVIGNKTQPLFDRRTGEYVKHTNDLLCDFGGEFACRWGAEAGKWAIIEKGAIPSLETSSNEAPPFPAALVIQGTSMLTSDPIECQTGKGSLLFRYWTNGDIKLQGCALGHREDSIQIQCAEESGTSNIFQNGTLVVFDFNKTISEPFTLNILPMWEKTARNKYLVIDEIAYVGSCDGSNAEVQKTTTEAIRTTHMTAVTRLIRPTATSPTPAPMTTTTYEPEPELMTDYCGLLNCNFNENACNYLNHGLTKVPWTLRNKGYGYPLSRLTDIKSTPERSQFVSTLLSPGDFAILESPSFDATKGINVLIFEYYRPSYATTIRLCLGTTNTKPLRTVASFTQCPPILRNLTSRVAFKWNNVHIQLPPGTTHFYLVAHNTDKNNQKAAIALDNLRVAVCDAASAEASYDTSEQN
uniref:MAM domain-containing protein n=1 Tax=Panagrellus redivivus TaxID=6233 RepID=A0A7E4VK04_PANRE